MDTVLLIVALALVAFWTGRLARAKRRNPWIWGGAAFALGGIPTVYPLLALVPLVVLMFLKSPQQQEGSGEDTVTCSRCQGISAGNSRFCTNCGWELTKPSQTRQEEEGLRAPIARDAPEEELADVANTVPQVEAPGLPEEAPVAPPEPVTVVAQEIAPPASPETAPEPAQEEPPPNAPRYRKPVPVDAPTPAAMTERGVRLFNQGRIQESIDQFTKAIALDANYTEAWAKRAEAYALLGRGDEAAEDRRRLDSLGASSTSAPI